MSFEMEENKILLFPNRDRSNLKSPLITGKANIGGELVKAAAWKSKDGSSITGKLSIKDGTKYVVVGTFAFKDNPSKDFTKAKENKQEEKKPDKVGDLVFHNKNLRLALWKRQGKIGVFLSGLVQDKSAVTAETESGESSSGRTPLPSTEDLF